MGKYRSLLINIGIFAINIFATKLIAFFMVPLYTASMSPLEYGVADMAQTVQNLLTPVLTLSIADGVLRFSIESSRKKDIYISSGLYVTIFSCIAAFVLLPLLNNQIFGGLGQYKILFWVVYSAGAFQTFFSNVARAHGHLRLIASASVMTALLTCVSSVLLIVYLDLGVTGYLASLAFGAMFADALYIVVGGFRNYIVFARFNDSDVKEDLRPLLHYSLPLVPNSVFWWVGMGVSRFFITGSLGVAASGLYAAASKLPNLINSAYSIFQQAWTLSSFQEYGQRGLSDFYSNVFKALQLLLVFVCEVLIMGAPVLSAFFLQKDFYVGWIYIPLVSVGVFLSCLNSFYGSVFTSSKQTGVLMRTTFLGAAICVIASAVLTPSLGIAGAALSTSICNGAMLLSRVRLSRGVIDFKVNWTLCISSLFVMLAQSYAFFQFGTTSLAAVCVCGVCLISIQVCSCIPMLRSVLRFAKHRQR